MSTMGELADQVEVCTKNGIGITFQTLVGHDRGSFPLKHGNCFSIKCDNEWEYRIVNFVVENLEEALRRGCLEYPIEILPLDKSLAVIVDSRIPDNWFTDRYCEVCCPEDLLPVNQQMRKIRARARVEEFIIKIDAMEMVRHDLNKQPDFHTDKEKEDFIEKEKKLREDWTIIEETGVTMANSEYMDDELTVVCAEDIAMEAESFNEENK